VSGNGWLLLRSTRFTAGATDDSELAARAVSSSRKFFGCRRQSEVVAAVLAISPRLQTVREIRLSDNSSFWDQRYPALMLTDTSFLRNPHYHQRTDTPETLDYARMTQVAYGVASAMRKLLR
jgi:hypothetical protein